MKAEPTGGWGSLRAGGAPTPRALTWDAPTAVTGGPAAGAGDNVACRW
jgi:hypothetical protein